MTSPGPINLQLNKASAAAALTPAARRLHRAILRTFAATGRAPARTEVLRLAAALGVEVEPTCAELAERDLVAFDDAGEIRAAYPFSPTPTAIQASWHGGPAVYAMCAIDALGMSAMLGQPVRVVATAPGGGEAITVEVDGGQARWTPSSAVVFAGATSDACCPSVDRSCGHINFFTTAHAASTWAAQHPEVAGTVLGQQEALAEAVGEFGHLLRDTDSGGAT